MLDRHKGTGPPRGSKSRGGVSKASDMLFFCNKPNVSAMFCDKCHKIARRYVYDPDQSPVPL